MDPHDAARTSVARHTIQDIAVCRPRRPKRGRKARRADNIFGVVWPVTGPYHEVMRCGKCRLAERRDEDVYSPETRTCILWNIPTMAYTEACKAFVLKKPIAARRADARQGMML